VDGLWATKSEGVWLIVRAISVQDFHTVWPWYRQTDWHVTTCNALYYSASRGKKQRPDGNFHPLKLRKPG